MDRDHDLINFISFRNGQLKTLHGLVLRKPVALDALKPNQTFGNGKFFYGH